MTTTIAATTAAVTTTTTGVPFSDIRLKTDISEVGVSHNGHQLYQFCYLSDDESTQYIGVMAQE
ncbi:MAG: hypothetical protein ACI9J2_000816 [Saprospiraceae bacterium]|jgi:hypothetical protein